jgi:hypothetical protein
MDAKTSTTSACEFPNPIGSSAMYVVGGWPATSVAAATDGRMSSLTTPSYTAVESIDSTYLTTSALSASSELMEAGTDFGEYCPPEVSEMLIADNWIVTSELDFVETETIEN